MKNREYLENKRSGGISILGVLLLAVILLFVLSYFDVSIRGVVESPTGQENINYVKGTSKSFWDRYFRDPVHYLWQDVWVRLFWNPFIYNMERIRDGQSTDFDNAANNLKLHY